MNIEFYPTVSAVRERPTLNPIDTATREVEEQLEDSPGSFVLRPEFMAVHGLGDYLVRSSRFHLREDWSEGRSDSEHSVYFGELELEIDNDETVSVPTAAKPYARFGPSAAESAVHEYAALEYFGDHSNLKTFEPIGFWVDEHGGPTLLTVFEEPVISLDNVDWARTGSDPLREQYDLFTALQKSAQILARLHLAGYAHRDAQIKNMAVDTVNDQIRLIDLPSLVAIDGSEEGDEIQWRHDVADDLDTLVSSVLRRGYMADYTPGTARDMIKKALLDPHNSLLRHPAYQHRLGPFALSSLDTITEDILEKV